MVAIQGTYSKITTTIAVYQFYVNPFDLYGNLLNEMTIEVDSTLAACEIYLPELATLNNSWNIKINVISLTGATFPVSIGVQVISDTIGSASAISLAANGRNAELSPISEINWAANVTA